MPRNSGSSASDVKSSAATSIAIREFFPNFHERTRIEMLMRAANTETFGASLPPSLEPKVQVP
jgi:hypothetical protein